MYEVLRLHVFLHDKKSDLQATIVRLNDVHLIPQDRWFIFGGGAGLLRARFSEQWLLLEPKWSALTVH